ncbi:bifunctional heptose 7-phosphate kinase/heptose 1-phosphate adenyltransferase [Oleidesulfovibrio sp.]|uniref:bifunctional heptose 7-phosphate kinase/heptose 1-phosphate adenyltransferase n=1 Tax=Oleidesulfovibrio sp. TaxID=2909707 RepID=UPI003A884486
MTYSFDTDRLCGTVGQLCDKKVLIVGDVMVDEYLIGDAERISPEAPVPVVTVEREKLLIGGAGNVAKNIQSLGGKPALISLCGTGSNAEALRNVLQSENLDATLVAIEGRRTTFKTRVLARQQQMVRIDREDTSALQGEGLTRLLQAVEDQLAEHDVIIVSDYGKGLVTEEFMQRLNAMLDVYEGRHGKRHHVFVDPKTRNFHLYKHVFILTPNAKETSEGARLPTGSKEEILAAGTAIFAMLECDKLLTTLGAQGMALFDGAGKVWHIPTTGQSVFDVTGAGDTVIATLALAQAAKIDLLDSCMLANFAAGIVVGQVGAASVTPDELLEAIKRHDAPAVSRWL